MWKCIKVYILQPVRGCLCVGGFPITYKYGDFVENTYKCIWWKIHTNCQVESTSKYIWLKSVAERRSCPNSHCPLRWVSRAYQYSKISLFWWSGWGLTVLHIEYSNISCRFWISIFNNIVNMSFDIEILVTHIDSAQRSVYFAADVIFSWVCNGLLEYFLFSRYKKMIRRVITKRRC